MSSERYVRKNSGTALVAPVGELGEQEGAFLLVPYSIPSIIYKIYSIAEPQFTKVGSSMLYFEKTPSSYHEAIRTCANYEAQLVELYNKEEWSEVNP